MNKKKIEIHNQSKKKKNNLGFQNEKKMKSVLIGCVSIYVRQRTDEAITRSIEHESIVSLLRVSNFIRLLETIFYKLYYMYLKTSEMNR